ncbi:MAG: TlpA disulfide reductase family protein [Cyclobacteriaceae bacterium]
MIITNRLLILILAILIISCNNSDKNKSGKPIKVGNILEISDYDLTSINKEKIDEDKLILIDFWATWCGPCIASFPHLEELQKKYVDDLQILAISDEKVDVVAKFLAKKNINLSFLNDLDKKLFKRFNISVRPISCLISKNGKFLWVGSSQDFEPILIKYLHTGEIPKPTITELNKIYYDESANLAPELINNDYSLSEGKDPKLYFAKNQKNEKDLVNIKYISVPVTDIIMDFYQVGNLNFVNNRPELDTILLNIEAKSDKLTYGEVKNKILKDIQNTYKFNIRDKIKTTDVYLLTIVDENALEKNIETVDGGGFVERKDGQHLITRLSLNQLASYFQSRLKLHIKYEGLSDSKYNFTFDNFEDLNDLEGTLKNVGISLSKQIKDIEYLEIN